MTSQISQLPREVGVLADGDSMAGGRTVSDNFAQGVLSNSHTEHSALRLMAVVFLPFAAGYYLSYLFRTVNAQLSGRLISEFSLDAGQLGLLTSAYFLTATVAQLPVGIALDRFGPRLVQIVSLLVAAAGALLFAMARDYLPLFLGRALIGLGVASALMSGLKAIVLWFPKERVASLNGVFIAVGAAGALTASAPTEWALGFMSWRELFLGLAGLTASASLLIFIVVPRRAGLASQQARIADGDSQKRWGSTPILSHPELPSSFSTGSVS